MGTGFNEKEELRGESHYTLVTYPVIRLMAGNNSEASKDLSVLSD